MLCKSRSVGDQSHNPHSKTGTEKLVDFRRSIKSPILRQAYWFVGRPIDFLLCVDEINDGYEEVSRRFANDRDRSANFFDHALNLGNVRLVVSERDLARIPRNGPVVCVANHPCGGIDGIILGSILASVRADSKLLVNYLLGAVEEMKEWTIEVNPFGSKRAARMNVAPLKEVLRWLREGHCLGTFPAGTVAHYNLKKRMVTDPQWNPNTATLIQRSGASVVPIYLEGKNTMMFQLLSLLHPRLRTAFLGRELMNKRGCSFHVKIGRPIPPARLRRFDTAEALSEFLRLNTYLLRERDSEKEEKMHRRPLSVTRPKMEPICQRMPASALIGDIQALPEERRLVEKGIFTVYYAEAEQIPNLLHEIGRVREETFRVVDEGTGKPSDIDRFDAIYHHLFLWNNETCEIAGAYRLCFVDRVVEEYGVEGLYCNTLFEFRKGLLEQLNPAIELGRSFITEKYQKQKGLLALLWRGIGELVGRFPEYKTLFGAVCMTTDTYRPLSKILMLEYLRHNSLHPTLQKLIHARVPPRLNRPKSLRSIAFGSSLPELEDVSSLVSEFEGDNRGVPILLKHYLRLNGVILCFGIDQGFSDALDGFIVVDLTKSNPRLLRKYLGRSAYGKFITYHSKRNRGSLVTA